MLKDPSKILIMIRSFIPIGISLLVIPFLISCNVITVPSNAATDTYFEEGVGLYQSGEYELALYAFSRDLSLDARSFRSYAYRAITYHTLGQYESAIQDYNSAILLKSDYPYTYHNRAIAYFELGMYDLSMSDYQTAVALGLVGPVVYNNIGLVSFYQRNLDLALESYQEAMRLGLENSTIFMNNMAAYVSIGDMTRAAKNLDKACSLNKDLCPIAAKEEESVALSLFPTPNYDSAKGYQAQIDLLKDQFVGPAATIELATIPAPTIAPTNTVTPLVSRPQTPEPIQDVFNRWYGSKRTPTPVTDPSKASNTSQSGGNFDDPYHMALKAYDSFKIKKYTDAIRIYQKAIDFHPHNGPKYAPSNDLTYHTSHRSEWYFYKGLSYYHLGQYQAAIRDFQDAVKFNPNYAEAHWQRGKSNQRLNMHSRAKTYFDKACKLDYKWCNDPYPTTTPSPVSRPAPTYIP